MMDYIIDTVAGNPVRMTGQLIGFIPMILGFFTYIYNDRRKNIGFKMLSDGVSAIHFLMLGEMSGCVINIVNTVRDYIFSRKGKKWASHIMIPITFVLISMGVTLASWEGIKSILPLTGTCLAIVGFWCSKPHIMRRFNLPGVGLWLIYGVITGSVSTCVGNTISIISMLIAEKNYRKQSATSRPFANR